MEKRKRKEVNVLKNDILVSVIMPTYNTPEEYLKKSVESILNQSYSNIEFIIICDGCIEDEKIIENYKDNRIKIIRHIKNEGIAKSLNEAIDIAKGKYIARMDSDDISLKNRIKIQVQYMEKNKNTMVCGMDAKCIGETKRVKSTYNIRPQEIEIQLLYMNCIIHPTVMLRKSFLAENNIRYNEDFQCSQDFELWARIVDHNNFTIIPKIGLLHRAHKNQISQKKTEIQKKLRYEIINTNIKKIKYENEKDAKNLLLILSGSNEINMSNCKEIIELANSIIEKQYNTKLYKKVLYNRIFQIIISTKKLRKHIIKILKENAELLNFNNLKYLMYKTFKFVEENILNLFYK